MNIICNIKIRKVAHSLIYRDSFKSKGVIKEFKYFGYIYSDNQSHGEATDINLINLRLSSVSSALCCHLVAKRHPSAHSKREQSPQTGQRYGATETMKIKKISS